MSRQQPVQIILAAEAEGDLQAIYNQRLAQRGAEGLDGAEALLDRLFDAIASLADFPLKGPIPPELLAIGIADWRQLSLPPYRSEEHTSELQSLMRISYAVFCLKKKNKQTKKQQIDEQKQHTKKY